MNAQFEYDGKTWKIPFISMKYWYERNLQVMLPDGTVLEVGKWLETDPPQPKNIHQVDVDTDRVVFAFEV